MAITTRQPRQQRRNEALQLISKAQLLQLAREIEIETNIRRMEIARERFASKIDSVVVVAGHGGGF